MKKGKFSLLLMLVAVATMFATTTVKAEGDGKKDATKVSKIEAGTTLGDKEVGLLNVVANGPDVKSRGAAKEVTLNKVTYKAGQKLTKEEAEAINKAVAEYYKGHKEPDAKTRGAVCYYYYCDYYGNCYYVYYYC